MYEVNWENVEGFADIIPVEAVVPTSMWRVALVLLLGFGTIAGLWFGYKKLKRR